MMPKNNIIGTLDFYLFIHFINTDKSMRKLKIKPRQ